MTNSKQVECTRCHKKTDALAVFPGTICLECYSVKEGQAPLTESDFNGMMNTFQQRPSYRRKYNKELKHIKKFGYGV